MEDTVIDLDLILMPSLWSWLRACLLAGSMLCSDAQSKSLWCWQGDPTLKLRPYIFLFPGWLLPSLQKGYNLSLPSSSTSEVTCLLKSSHTQLPVMLFFFPIDSFWSANIIPYTVKLLQHMPLLNYCLYSVEFSFSKSLLQTSEVHMKLPSHLLPWIFSSTGFV